MRQLVYIFLFASIAAKDPDCHIYKGRCYKVYPTASGNFVTAAKTCSKLNYGVPVIIRSAKEEQFIRSLFPQRNVVFWMGLLTTQKIGGWTWITNEILNYSNWGAGELNSSENEQCSISTPSAWRDTSCRSNRKIACESRVNITCDCNTQTAEVPVYNTKKHGIVQAKRFCCCQKTDHNAPFRAIPVNDTRKYTILAESTKFSKLKCASDCARQDNCVAFSYSKSTGKCQVLSSILNPINEPLDPPTARGDYACL